MNQPKRYELESVRHNKFFRITALVDIPEFGVKKGDKGGLIESEFNLPQEGKGWIDDSSSVSDQCQVKAGLVCESSNLEKNVVVEGGTIEDSLLSGNLVVKRYTVIKGCGIDVPNNDTLQSEIRSSTLENVNITGACQIRHSRVLAGRRLRIEKDVSIVKSDVYVGLSTVQELKVINSFLKTGRFLTYEPFHLENAFVEVSKRFSIANHNDNYYRNGNQTIIKGAEDNPVKIQGEIIKIVSSTITESAKITGDVEIYNSTISGFATINLKNGAIYDCIISELATVVQVNDDKPIIQEVELFGDDKYEC